MQKSTILVGFLAHFRQYLFRLSWGRSCFQPDGVVKSCYCICSLDLQAKQTSIEETTTLHYSVLSAERKLTGLMDLVEKVSDWLVDYFEEAGIEYERIEIAQIEIAADVF